MFKEFPSQPSFPEIDKEILRFWEENNIFEKSVAQKDPKKAFVFYEGPPTANGKPGIHHVISRTIKDCVCRLKTMQGYRVERKAGWDTHGLPVEIEVEKELGIDGKDQVLEYGIDRFNQKCKESVFSYKKEWDEVTRRIGFWVDLENPYITYTNEYIESVWWIIKEFWKKELVYLGHKILPYCPRCQTPLSSHEVSQGYKEVSDPSVFIKVRIPTQDNTYFLVWTTTPWTLLSNVALAFHPEIVYVKVHHQGQNLILAQARLGVLQGDFEVIEEYTGAQLADIDYQPIFPYVKPEKRAYYTVLGDFVSVDEGTGIVHMAPAFGEDDYQLGLKYDLPVVQPVDPKGCFTEEITPWTGMFVKDADTQIIDDLQKRSVLYREEEVVHSYPHCWRCDSPLLYYARESWYIKTTAIKDRLIANNNKIDWYPREVGSGRFGEWLENNVDWALSRDRFWGTPLPIWICQNCDYQYCIGGIDELREKSGLDIDIDLHKPHIDNVRLKCDKCGSEMKRTPEVIDCWFDSGSMPFAQFHYPFENVEKFKANFPADFISEGVDQTRGWFYSLLVLGVFLFDQPTYKTCLSIEMILDKEGQKMSKHIGNTVDPFDHLNREGADALRWYLITVSPPWVPTRFDPEGVQEVMRKFMGTLANTYSFFAMYANIDKFEYGGERIPAVDRPVIDRWILSSLSALVERVNDNLKRYDLTKAARAISIFVIDDLSNWYIRRCRRRFWKSDMGTDKTAAYQTLYETLLSISKLMAPFAPFIADETYRNLTQNSNEYEESVHLSSYPKPNEAPADYRDELLEAQMDLGRRTVFLGRSLRNEAKIKVRQPLGSVIVVAKTERRRELLNSVANLITDELNVKKLRFVENENALMSRRAEPVFRNLGPKFGKTVNKAAAIIRSFSDKEIAHLLDKGEEFVMLDGREARISREDVEIVRENQPGFVVGTEGDLTVALEIEISPDLLLEGLAREFVNRVQNMRKEANFEVIDRIVIHVQASEKMAEAVQTMSDYIRSETLAEKIHIGKVSGAHQKDWRIGSEIAAIGIEKL